MKLLGKRSVVVLAPSLLLASSLLLALACSSTPTDKEEQVTGTGAKLTSDILANTDVAQIRYDITRVSCAGETITPFTSSVTKNLDDILLPAGIPQYTQPVFDEGSQHLFADNFVILDVGCYDIVTTPVDAAGYDSKQCFAAKSQGVQVKDRETTEVLLVNQCLGEGKGAVDTVSAVNHPPVLLGFSFNKSKFVERCAEQLMCVTAMDPDKDGLKFTWSSSSLAATTPEVVDTTENADGSVTQCVKLYPHAAGQHQMTLLLQDLFYDNAGGLMTVEDYLAAQGNTGQAAQSRDELAFPFYVADQGPVPAPEDCTDNLDNDCDGVINNGCAPVVPCGQTFAASGGDEGLAPTLVELGATSGTIDVSYNTYWIDDRIIVRYEGNVIHDSGCLGTDVWIAPVSVPFGPGTATSVEVQVVPDCNPAEPWGTAWHVNVSCPK